MITNDICKTCDGRCCYGCKYYNRVSGCTQTYEDRYPSCKIYPFVERDGIIMLDPDCPGWRIFGEMYKEACDIVLEAG